MNSNGKSKRRWGLWVSAAILLILMGSAGFMLLGTLKSNGDIDPSKLSVIEKGDLARQFEIANGQISWADW